jgi:hypothetical protein
MNRGNDLVVSTPQAARAPGGVVVRHRYEDLGQGMPPAAVYGTGHGIHPQPRQTEMIAPPNPRLSQDQFRAWVGERDSE